MPRVDGDDRVHGTQHTVIGPEGVTVPVGVPPSASHGPGDKLVTLTLSAVGPVWQPAWAGREMVCGVPKQFCCGYKVTVALHIEGPHAQGVQPRLSMTKLK
jgi:hypothetical protein